MGNKNIKKCRYCDCKYDNKEINISTDKYVNVGNLYFHENCYELKKIKTQKEENQKKDFQYIKNLWLENISNSVVYSQLFQILNNLIARGISSEYLVFTMQYCIEHKLNLNYPAGLTYFVDKKEIKDAYKKHQIEKNGFKRQSDFSVTSTMEDASPKFAINKSKTIGFNSILGGNK